VGVAAQEQRTCPDIFSETDIDTFSETGMQLPGGPEKAPATLADVFPVAATQHRHGRSRRTYSDRGPSGSPPSISPLRDLFNASTVAVADPRPPTAARPNSAGAPFPSAGRFASCHAHGVDAVHAVATFPVAATQHTVIRSETEVPRLPPARAAYARGRGRGTWRSQLVCVFGVVVVTCTCVGPLCAC
jgi:hypothetical protein